MLRFSEIWFLALCLQIAVCRPAEEPTKFSLNGSVQSIERMVKPEQEIEATKFEKGMDVASEAQVTIRPVMSPKIDRTSQGKILQSYEKDRFANFLAPKTGETVRLETEAGQSILEKPKQNPVAGLLENYLRPTPIVDGIREEQKYGNNGDKFIGIGRALVNGFEGLSNLVNVVVDLPLKAAKQTSRGITEALNQVGARLVGLQ